MQHRRPPHKHRYGKKPWPRLLCKRRAPPRRAMASGAGRYDARRILRSARTKTIVTAGRRSGHRKTGCDRGGTLRERAHMMRDTSGNDNLNDKWGWMAPLTPSNAHTLEGLATAVSRLNTRSYSLRLAPLRFISYPTSRRSMYRADARGRHAARRRLPRNKTALSPPPVKKKETERNGSERREKNRGDQTRHPKRRLPGGEYRPRQPSVKVGRRPTLTLTKTPRRHLRRFFGSKSAALRSSPTPTSAGSVSVHQFR